MKNKISDLRDHMFAALERLGDTDLTPEQVKIEIEKARAVSDIGKVIVESAKTEILYARLTGKKDPKADKYLEVGKDDDPEPAGSNKLERPKAVYSNPQHSHSEN